MSIPPNERIQRNIRYDDLTLASLPCSDPAEERFKRACQMAMRDPGRDPMEEANAFRDTPPEDASDELQLAKGEIAWLREAIRRQTEVGE